MLKNILEEPVVARRKVRAPRRPVDCPPVAAQMLPDQTRDHPALELVREVVEDLQRIGDSYDTGLE